MNQFESNKCKVIIIGAGAAGLGAAQFLLTNGVDDVVILEGSNRIGGRVHTIPFGPKPDDKIELGANWIHGGTIANPLFTLGMQHKFIEENNGEIPLLERFDSDSCFAKSNGKIINLDCGQRAIKAFFEVERAAFILFFQNTPSIGRSANLQKYINEELARKLHQEFPLEEQYDVKCVFNSLQNYLRFHVSDELEKLSLKQYGTFQEIPGGDVILPHGFQNLLEKVVENMPVNSIRYNQQVLHIDWSNTTKCRHDHEFQISAVCHDGTKWSAEHVIVTSSLGYLKKHHKTLFNPLLPRHKIAAIQNIGFGCTDKIFLEFEHPFWKYGHTKFVGFAWSNEELADNRTWEKSIYGFEQVYNNPNVLAFWIAGNGAEVMETLPVTVVMDTCVKLIRQFTGNDNIPLPKNIQRSTWRTNQFALGSYSYATTLSGIPEIESLAQPLPSVDQPALLFAGEATHPCYYSTVHGAYLTGIRAAKQILQTVTSKL